MCPLARQLQRKQKPLTPFCVMVGTTGERTILQLHFRDRHEKAYTFACVRQLMRESGTTGYALVMEAWAAPQLPGEEFVGFPADHPKRFELLIAVSSDGFTVTASNGRSAATIKGP
jgi:hypothetical protein